MQLSIMVVSNGDPLEIRNEATTKGVGRLV